MNRNKLIAQVKNEYARLASDEAQQHFHQTAAGLTGEAYYENLLNAVVGEITKGTFDGFHSGKEITEAVANNKEWLSDWGGGVI